MAETPELNVLPESISAEEISYWDTNEIMKNWKETQVESMSAPQAQEAVTNLKFLITFSIGMNKMGLVKMAEKYSKAADIYVRFLRQIGYKSGLSAGPRTQQSVCTSLDNIIRQASFGIVREDEF